MSWFFLLASEALSFPHWAERLVGAARVLVAPVSYAPMSWLEPAGRRAPAKSTGTSERISPLLMAALPLRSVKLLLVASLNDGFVVRLFDWLPPLIPLPAR